jgi:hypothetical protein
MEKQAACYCCTTVRRLYPVGTVLGLKRCCAECCRKTYGCRPGYTTDGIRLAVRTPEDPPKGG